MASRIPCGLNAQKNYDLHPFLPQEEEENTTV